MSGKNRELLQEVEKLRAKVKYLHFYATDILGIPEVSKYRQKKIEDYF